MLNIVNGKIILDLEYSRKPDGKEPTVRKIPNFFPTIFLENIRKVGFFSDTLYIFSARPLNQTLLIRNADFIFAEKCHCTFLTNDTYAALKVLSNGAGEGPKLVSIDPF